MDFDWDDQKAGENLAKHGVSFEEAATAFGDPLSFTIDDPDHSAREHRFVLLGQTYSGKLSPWFTSIAGSDRLTSARLATRRERKAYEEDPLR